MKYIKYFLLVALAIFTKIVGLIWFFVAVPFRKYAREVVYSYALEHDIKIKRLMERNPALVDSKVGWILQDVHNVGMDGLVLKHDVGWIQFWFVVFFLWGWLDDDANEDTFSAGHNQRFIDGDLKNTWQSKLWRNDLIKANDRSTYGNTFDLGNYRARFPNFSFPAALIWNTRNTAYKFGYLFEQTSNRNDVFVWTIGGVQYVWVPDGHVSEDKYWQIIVGKKY